MDEYMIPEIEEEQKQWRITDDASADWAARIIKEEYAERDRLLALVNVERERLDAKEDEIRSRCERKTGYLLAELERYMATVKTRSTATQSKYELLNATLVYKYPKVDVAPADGLLAWLKANRPELVKVNEEPDWAAIKKNLQQIGENVYALKDTGEIVDGVVPKEVPGKFEVK